jgi:hypothetical protein
MLRVLRCGAGVPVTPMATRSTETPAGTHTRRVIVVANEVLGGDRLLEEVTRHLGSNANAEVMVVSPALVGSPLALAAGNVDDDISAARDRLEASVRALRQRGIQATGEVGESDPNLAIQDAVAKFAADEVIIVAHARERANWQEKDVVERAKRDLTVPITYIEVDSGGAAPAVRDVTDVRPEGNRVAADRAQAEFETDYLPPLSRADRLTLALGVLGILGLWLLAANCQGDLFQDYSADDPACIALLTIASLMTTVTIMHVVMLLLLRSGNYRGGLTRFISKTILYSMPVALVAGVVLTIVAS